MTPERARKLLDLAREMRREQRKFYAAKRNGTHVSPAASIRLEQAMDRFLAEEDGQAQPTLDFGDQ